MLLNTGTKLCLLDTFGRLLFIFLVFAKFIFVLTKFKNTADRWVSIGCNFDQIKPFGFRDFNRFFRRHNPEHFAI